MTRTLCRWPLLGLLVCVAPLLSGCALLPGHPATLQAGVVRAAIERATLVRLDEVTPPVAATGLQAMRATMSGAGRGGTTVWTLANMPASLEYRLSFPQANLRACNRCKAIQEQDTFCAIRIAR